MNFRHNLSSIIKDSKAVKTLFTVNQHMLISNYIDYFETEIEIIDGDYFELNLIVIFFILTLDIIGFKWMKILLIDFTLKKNRQ